MLILLWEGGIIVVWTYRFLEQRRVLTVRKQNVISRNVELNISLWIWRKKAWAKVNLTESSKSLLQLRGAISSRWRLTFIRISKQWMWMILSDAWQKSINSLLPDCEKQSAEDFFYALSAFRHKFYGKTMMSVIYVQMYFFLAAKILKYKGWNLKNGCISGAYGSNSYSL